MEPKYTKVSHCRVCGSKNITGLGITKRYYLINLDQTVTLSYAVCQRCGFLFQGEYVGDTFLNFYYSRSPMLRRKEATKFEIDQNHRQAAFLTRHIDVHAKRVLEIGAHTGIFLLHLAKEFGCSSYFDELSEEARSILVSQQGLVDFRSETKDVKIDIVILRHILEHIFDLDTFLDYIKSVTHSKSFLFVEVPDWSHLDEHTDPLIFEHLNHFSTHNLMILMHRAGWKCEALEKSIVEDDPATPNRVQRLLFRPSNIPLEGMPITKDFCRFFDRYYGDGNRAIDAYVTTSGKSRRIALCPASHLTFSALIETRLHDANIVGIFDSDPKKNGKLIEGIKVRPLKDLNEAKPDLILLFTMAYEREIRDSFNEMGLTAEVVSITQLFNKV